MYYENHELNLRSCVKSLATSSRDMCCWSCFLLLFSLVSSAPERVASYLKLVAEIRIKKEFKYRTNTVRHAKSVYPSHDEIRRAFCNQEFARLLWLLAM